MENRFECSLCLDDFKDPRILSCIHTFCRECLEEYLTKTIGPNLAGATFECPLCRSKTTLPNQGIDGIQKNFYLAQQDTKPTLPMCSDHPKEDLRFYCCDCKTTICRDCKVISHDGHSTDMVNKIIGERKQKLEGVLNTTEDKINKNEIKACAAIKTDTENLERTMSVLHDNTQWMQKEIDSLHEVMLSIIKSHLFEKRLAKRDMQTTFRDKRRKLTEYQKTLSHAVEHGDVDTVFRLFDELIENEAEITNLDEPPPSHSHTSSDVDDFDAAKLEASFIQLTETIMNGIKEFRGKDTMLKMFDSFSKEAYTLRDPTSGETSEKEVVSKGIANDGPDDRSKEVTGLQSRESAPYLDHFLETNHTDPDLITVCQFCGSSRQNERNCYACREKFNIHKTYYSKNSPDAKRRKIEETVQSSTQQDSEQDCVVTKMTFDGPVTGEQTRARILTKKFRGGSERKQRRNKRDQSRKDTCNPKMSLPVSAPVCFERPYMASVVGSRDWKAMGEAWNCSACTFLNHPALQWCECCEVLRTVTNERGKCATTVKAPIAFGQFDPSLSYKPKPGPSQPYQPGILESYQPGPSTSSAVTPNNSIQYPGESPLEFDPPTPRYICKMPPPPNYSYTPSTGEQTPNRNNTNQQVLPAHFISSPTYATAQTITQSLESYPQLQAMRVLTPDVPNAGAAAHEEAKEAQPIDLRKSQVLQDSDHVDLQKLIDCYLKS